MSIELNFTMNLANPIPLNGYLVMSGTENMPFAFLQSPASTFCWLSPVEVACTITVINAMSFYVRVPVSLSQGQINIRAWGLRSVKVNPVLPYTHQIQVDSYNSVGITA